MLNLITDPWIPIRRTDGGPDVIRPDQIADPTVASLDWPRPDLTLACYELLIGLVYLACPPLNARASRARPDQAALQRALRPLVPAFNLLGPGPLFMQDYQSFNEPPNPPDMLFIDSAGGSTAKKNADLMVKRDRYSVLPLPLAAMALFTLQAFAPSGGAGNRTSMRGGGPMVTLVLPEGGLWEMIWANVPYGAPLTDLTRLPWMRETEVSDQKQIKVPPGDGTGPPEPEVFFGQPRRLRLVGDVRGVSGVIQKPWGTNYVGWVHPLSPYYFHKDEKLPRHPKPGPFGYRNWRGVTFQTTGAEIAGNLYQYRAARQGEDCRLLVAGWAMSNMSPLDFLWSEQPVFGLDLEAMDRAADMVEAAEKAALMLASTVAQGCGEAEIGTGAGARARLAIFAETQVAFEARLASMKGGIPDDLARGWLADMAKIARALFDAAVLPGLPDMTPQRQEEAAKAKRRLTAALTGGRAGKDIWNALGLEMPKPAKSKESA
ncbi:MAG: type I-E CRISPR-associated protein Cse1/CasA [Rhodobacteraceae bacterium]|nr:type I-E CRISPR-associated protein Cse1/CasA [Paracoccaceae bacterium]